MNYWWVNQGQTHELEVAGGYIWCPYRDDGGHKRPGYETLRGVKPGDIILSYYSKAVRHYGIARSYKYSFPKPEGFGKQWGAWGWRCDVDFYDLKQPVSSHKHIRLLRPHLRKKNNPIQRKTGFGNQPCYLGKITEGMLLAIERLSKTRILHRVSRKNLVGAVSLDHIQHKYDLVDDLQVSMIALRDDSQMKNQLLNARYGVGEYRERVAQLEKACRITAAQCHPALSACHIKPWREADDKEKLEAANGLLLPPGTAQMFSYGFFSFNYDGEVIKSSLLEDNEHLASSIPSNAKLKKKFNRAQQDFLEHHRDYVLLQATD